MLSDSNVPNDRIQMNRVVRHILRVGYKDKVKYDDIKSFFVIFTL